MRVILIREFQSNIQLYINNNTDTAKSMHTLNDKTRNQI